MLAPHFNIIASALGRLEAARELDLQELIAEEDSPSNIDSEGHDQPIAETMSIMNIQAHQLLGPHNLILSSTLKGCSRRFRHTEHARRCQEIGLVNNLLPKALAHAEKNLQSKEWIETYIATRDITDSSVSGAKGLDTFDIEECKAFVSSCYSQDDKCPFEIPVEFFDPVSAHNMIFSTRAAKLSQTKKESITSFTGSGMGSNADSVDKSTNPIMIESDTERGYTVFLSNINQLYNSMQKDAFINFKKRRRNLLTPRRILLQKYQLKQRFEVGRNKDNIPPSSNSPHDDDISNVDEESALRTITYLAARRWSVLFLIWSRWTIAMHLGATLSFPLNGSLEDTQSPSSVIEAAATIQYGTVNLRNIILAYLQYKVSHIVMQACIEKNHQNREKQRKLDQIEEDERKYKSKKNNKAEKEGNTFKIKDTGSNNYSESNLHLKRSPSSSTRVSSAAYEVPLTPLTPSLEKSAQAPASTGSVQSSYNPSGSSSTEGMKCDFRRRKRCMSDREVRRLKEEVSWLRSKSMLSPSLAKVIEEIEINMRKKRENNVQIAHTDSNVYRNTSIPPAREDRSGGGRGDTYGNVSLTAADQRALWKIKYDALMKWSKNEANDKLVIALQSRIRRQLAITRLSRIRNGGGAGSQSHNQKVRQDHLFTSLCKHYSKQQPLLDQYIRTSLSVVGDEQKAQFFYDHEEISFKKQFKEYTTKVTHYYLNECPLDVDWKVQRISNQTTSGSIRDKFVFVNVKTGKQQDENPNMLKVVALKNRQWMKATKDREKRLAEMDKFVNDLNEVKTEFLPFLEENISTPLNI
eukprot:Tbor_TRINITY_DN6040_c0_g1::TRINITY_DN6040_c0_g1_i1::g.11150::m.11150